MPPIPSLLPPREGQEEKPPGREKQRGGDLRTPYDTPNHNIMVPICSIIQFAVSIDKETTVLYLLYTFIL